MEGPDASAKAHSDRKMLNGSSRGFELSSLPMLNLLAPFGVKSSISTKNIFL